MHRKIPDLQQNYHMLECLYRKLASYWMQSVAKDVKTALAIVMYNPRYASSVIEKLLKSAIANAENNTGMKVDDLYVEECYANKGPTMKRIHPRAQGRAYRIEKRMSHITIVLNRKIGGKTWDRKLILMA